MTDLRDAAIRVLIGNARGLSTVPASRLYPHQWSWDSAFIALGLRHLSPHRAQLELEALLGAQWADGRIPHIVFDPATPADAYFPGPDFWQPHRRHDRVATSGIIQPPVHALAAWETFLADPAHARRRSFLDRLYPRLQAWHRYLLNDRDLGGGGLAATVHPWESGMDNSPAWDAPLARITPVPADAYRRRDLDHAGADQRPTDDDYGRYVRLAADYRDRGYADDAAAFGFAIEDPLTNALLAVAEHAMAAIAKEVDADPQPHLERAAAVTDALTTRLWDPQAGIFLARDLVGSDTIGHHTVAGLAPLAVPGLPVADRLVATLRSDRFGLGRVAMVPSYDLTAAEYSGTRYWRGPSWFNTSWIIWRGLREHSHLRDADRLRDSMLDTVATAGFREYVDPLSGRGLGADDFSWTAALTLDLLAEQSPEGSRC
ncbi:MGH1-like glycoside hydrolase domain-containing protein [Catellatospora vulcania]|uniref:MGH1-like glycoside hydrolase domain-containing protein n=1 Tax=Catellatospora vulcania TaxID=1460450 RepID=UPI0018AF6645|nr:trehalase family glycosidase [Catellatospora vulcania]